MDLPRQPYPYSIGLDIPTDAVTAADGCGQGTAIDFAG
jgi:hypothetical protein